MIRMFPLPVGCIMRRRCGACRPGLAALVFLSCLLAAVAGCAAPRIAMIPEVSPPLQQEEIFALPGPAAGNLLFSCAAGVGWVELSGRIVSWDPEKKTAGTSVPLPFAVSDPPFRQGDFLALQGRADDQLLVFDLARMEIRFAASRLPATRILGVDGRHLVYLDGATLVVCDWQNRAGVFRLETGGQDLFNCHFSPERILVMGRRDLFVFWKANGKFQPLPLPVPAAAPFVCNGENIFYGSGQRQLVNYSLRSRKAVWKLKLGHELKSRPLMHAGAIVAGTADNNVLCISRNGSVRWWLALNSILRHDLVPMADHLAAFLLNQEIRFIAFRDQRVTVFKIQQRPAGMPLAYKNDLYFLAAGAAGQTLQRVGNRYGIELILAPDRAQWLGTPVSISFQASNLLDPRIQCVIRDGSGKSVLQKKFTAVSRGQVVWLPLLAGVYRAQVSVVALNRKEEKEVSFHVYDPREVMQLLRFPF